eukprot:749646-Hanusia_phi.AAC.1
MKTTTTTTSRWQARRAMREERHADDDDDESEGEKKSGRKERRGRDKRKRDKDKRKKEGKKSSDSSSKKKGDVVDDAILDKCDDPHEVMEVYGWPMPLPDDAGRIRAYNVSSMTQEFWETYEEYFKPVTEEAVKSLLKEPDLDNDSSFTIPKLGVHWAQRSGGKEDVEVKDEMDLDGGGRGAMSSGRGAGTKRKASDMSPNVVGGDGQVYDSMESKLQTQKMTMRMLACFLHQVASSSPCPPPPSSHSSFLSLLLPLTPPSSLLPPPRPSSPRPPSAAPPLLCLLAPPLLCFPVLPLVAEPRQDGIASSSDLGPHPSQLLQAKSPQL